MNELFINKKIWNEFSDNQLSDYKKKIFDYYRQNGYFIINIQDVKTYNFLVSDTIRFTEICGFHLIKRYKMRLSRLMKAGYKYEPIFVFIKD